MEVFEGRRLPLGWLTYITDDGRPYFHCQATNTTQWAEPTTDEAGDIAAARTVTFGKRAGGYATISDAGSLPAGPIDVEKGATTTQRNLLLGFIDLSPVQCHFDVDTTTVKARLMAATLPYKLFSDAARVARNPDFVNEMTLDAVTCSFRDSPDFYGPFWLSATLMLVLFFSSNAAIYLAHSDKSNFDTMVVACFSVYGYLFGVPALAKAIALVLGSSAERDSIHFRPLVCVYGYSFALAIPLTILCAVPLPMVRYLVACLGATATVLFLLFSYKTELLEGNANFRLSFSVLFALAQISFYAAYPLYYFKA